MRFAFELLLIITGVLLIVYLFYSFVGTVSSPAAKQNSSGQVCIKDNCFNVELAITDAERERGLMYRQVLDSNKGMLFVFPDEGIHPFWMKNTLIPLDIVWADSAGTIVFISQNVQPCKSVICPSVIPNKPAKYVLEINSGICQQMELKVGDKLKIPTQGVPEGDF
jgi:uncharacterized membrane protein (UPF0127 family)